MTYLVGGIVGANIDRKTPVQEFTLGLPALDNGNQTWVYVSHSAILAANAATAVNGSFVAAAGTGYTNGPNTAAAVGDFGWVRKTTSPL